MCCLVTFLFLGGPRVAMLLWWLFDHTYVRDAFPKIFWLIVAILFAPWTGLFFLIAFSTGGDIAGWDWLLIGIGVVLDVGSYTGGAWGNRKRVFRR